MKAGNVFKPIIIAFASLVLLILVSCCILVWVVFKSDTPTNVANNFMKQLPVYTNVGNIGLSLKTTYPFFALHLDNVLVKENEESSDTTLFVRYLDLMLDLQKFVQTKEISVQKLWLGPSVCNLDTVVLNKLLSGDDTDSSGFSLNDMRADLSLFKIESLDFTMPVVMDSLQEYITAKNLSLDLKGKLQGDTIGAEATVMVPYAGLGCSNVNDVNIEAKLDVLNGNANLDLCAAVKNVIVSFDSLSAGSDNISVKLEALYSLEDSNFNGNVSLEMKNLLASLNNTTNIESDCVVLTLSDLEGVLDDTPDIKGSLLLSAGNGASVSLVDDSLDVSAALDNTNISLDFDMIDGSLVKVSPQLRIKSISADYNNDCYLDNCSFGFDCDASLDLNNMQIIARNAILNLNNNIVKADVTANVAPSLNLYTIVELCDIDIERVLESVPEVIKESLDSIDATGTVNAKASVYISDVNGQTVMEPQSAVVSLSDFSGRYGDFIDAYGHTFTLNVLFPNYLNGLDAILIKTISQQSTAKVNLDGSMLNAKIDSLNAYFYLYDVRNLQNMPRFESYAYMTNSTVTLDTISIDYKLSSIALDIENPFGAPKGYVDTYFDGLEGNYGRDLNVSFDHFETKLNFDSDMEQEDMLLRWKPVLKTALLNADVQYHAIPVEIPQIDFDFSLGRFDIHSAAVRIGNTNAEVSGFVENIGDFIMDKDTLRGNLSVTSDKVDLSQLISLSNYLSESDCNADDSIAIDSVMQSQVSGPFIVPTMADINLKTVIDTVIYNTSEFYDLKGDISLFNSSLIMQEVGFSSKAAQMQLTAKYQTPVDDDIFALIDFHLLDIDISELIHIIPAVDSVMPMLRSVDGRAQFHFDIESCLDSTYMPIYPTLIGSMAIEGADLVVMDNDVFKTIKKRLLMSKKAENKIDSLNVEAQVLRNRVDLYPFLIKMDKYQAIVGGRHHINNDLDCRYHISLTKSPLPFRLGVTVQGALDDIIARPLKHIRLSKCEYKRLYVPEKRNITDQRMLMMKQDILNTLRSNVRE
ncbi:MAG: hypothetical protein MJY71_07895 [Bacteroidaceae bacterium]|nr:hypothetical protein [Bacteroidaceae bacterium]